MPSVFKRSLSQGALFGFFAGILFGSVEIVASGIQGIVVLQPMRYAAGVVLGETAFTLPPLPAAVIGIAVHLALSALFGLIYGWIMAGMPREIRSRWRTQAPLGAFYGFMLWLVNFQIIARIAYPWFLDTAHWPQFILHAVFYGLPLAYMFAEGQRKVLPEQEVPRTEPAEPVHQ
ncbi:MAG: hypothetical protein C4524_12645 [Candidatus Zixiibacteriota bacterium]|nr:MAG: hypothetical protein C4524_12645 [candidate division Zixibacteria bacterium]